jgi:hypothetical protein
MRRKTKRRDTVLIENDKPLEMMSEMGPGVMLSEMDAGQDPRELRGGESGNVKYDGTVKEGRWKRKSKRLDSIAELP